MAVKLRRLAPTSKDVRRLKSTRLRVEVAETDGHDSNIFLWQSYGVNQYYDNANIDVPVGVCTLGDMAQVPVGAPVGDSPLFRRDYFDVYVRTKRIADDVWNAILEDVSKLLDAGESNAFVAADSDWIPSGVSSSSSSS